MTQHPSLLWPLGRVTDDGRTVRVMGWTVGLCMTGCDCHRNPAGGNLAVYQDSTTGSLGLVKFRAECSCCEVWTPEELLAVLRDVGMAQDIPSRPRKDAA